MAPLLTKPQPVFQSVSVELHSPLLTMGSGDGENARSIRSPILGSGSPRGKIRILSIALLAVFLLALAFLVVHKSGLGFGFGSDPDDFPWTKRMLSWQRAGFHFRTVINYMTGDE